MRAFFAVILAIFLGGSLGVGMTFARYGTSTSADALRPAVPLSGTFEAAGADAPKVSVDKEECDFGAVENDSVVSHTFMFKNVGKSPLILKSGGTTCGKCTIAKISEEKILPGESVGVTVQYSAGASTPKFRQSATILTNDPERPRVELGVSGGITAILSIDPPQLVFSKLSVHESRTLDAKLLNYITDKLNIVGHTWSDPSTEKFLNVEFKPFDAEALTQHGAKSGQLVSVTVKPGLPLGTLHQKLTITTDLPNKHVVELEILATISSDISIVGGGWNEEQGHLHVGPVQSKEGVTRKILLLARGPYRNDLEIKLGEVFPSFLRVTLGDKTTINNGLIVQFPVTITIPPGSPSANHLSAKIGRLGEVLLETTHPEAKQVKVPIRFAVEE
jgi:hypothetical protein